MLGPQTAAQEQLEIRSALNFIYIYIYIKIRTENEIEIYEILLKIVVFRII